MIKLSLTRVLVLVVVLHFQRASVRVVPLTYGREI